MLRITKETEYAFMLLGAVLAADGTAKNTAYLAGRTRIAVPMSGKVLKRLTHPWCLRRLPACPRRSRYHRAGRSGSDGRYAGTGRMRGKRE